MNREEFVDSNMGLVRMCAARFSGKGFDYEDLFQSGCLGLVKAAERFNPELGCKFSTYAVPVILGEIRSLFRDGRPVKISREMQSLSQKFKCEYEKFMNDKGRSPTLLEMSEIMSMDQERTAEVMNASWGVESLTDAESGGERDLPEKENQVERLTDSISLWQTIESLPDEDKKLIGLRYYMNKTQKETASLLGASQVQISRREKKILLCMRAAL